MFRRNIPLLLIGTVAAALLLYPQTSVTGAQNGLRLCAQGIIPSLFPYLVLTNLWCSLGYSEKLGRKTEKLMTNLFHLSGNVSSAILIGFIGGFPAGAKMVAELYKNGNVQRKHAEQVLLFCSNAGPAFIFGIIGHGLFHSGTIGFFLWVIHFIGALTIGILFRPALQENQLSICTSGTRKTSISSAIVTAIRCAGSDALLICMYVVFFSILACFIQLLIPENCKNALIYKILLSALELTSSADLLKGISLEIAFIAASALLAWNGLCVHCQVLSVAAESGLSLKKYFFGKMMHMLLSLTLACLLAPHLPFSETIEHTFHVADLNKVLILICILSIAAAKTSYGKSKSFRI